MSSAAGIPPYGERDEELARQAIAAASVWPNALLREVAGAIATARAEGYAQGAFDARRMFALVVRGAVSDHMSATAPR